MSVGPAIESLTLLVGCAVPYKDRRLDPLFWSHRLNPQPWATGAPSEIPDYEPQSIEPTIPRSAIGGPRCIALLASSVVSSNSVH